jgi:hypothetical protein
LSLIFAVASSIVSLNCITEVRALTVNIDDSFMRPAKLVPRACGLTCGNLGELRRLVMRRAIGETYARVLFTTVAAAKGGE